jgi:hypothetical protein
MKPIKASRIALILLFTLAIRLSTGGCKKAPNGNSSARTLTQTSANATPAPTISPVEAWVVSEKQTYREGDTIALTLRLVNRTNNTVRLPVPIVCTDVTGWGELQLDLFINGRRYDAACHVPDAIELESNGELTRRIISRRFDVPVGKSPWNTPGHFTVYAVWQRKDISKQTENDFLGRLVSHPAEFDIVASKPKNVILLCW